MTATTIEGKRPRTASREVRRQQLIEATIASIAQNGLTGTTMATVTGLADLSMGIVSFHFRSKENLLQETLLYLADEHRNCWVRSLADSGLDPAAKLAAVMDAHFHPSTCNDTRIPVWFAFFGEASYRQVYRDKVAAFDEERTEIVTGLCQELLDRGGNASDVSSDVSGEDVASNLESLADGLWLSIMLYPGWLDRRGAKRQIHSYLRAVFPNDFASWPGVVEEEAPLMAGGLG